MNLRAWMAREGLTLTAAANQLGVPIPTLHTYITGKRRPRLDRATAISNATGGAVSVADLLPELAAAIRAQSGPRRGGQVRKVRA